MGHLTVDPAEPSTTEYYWKNKDTSFPINLYNDVRGRAIVFVMTRRRPGWQKEVWDLYKMFKAVSVEPEFFYDPSALTIETALLKFTTDERTKNADMIFTIFIGHGYIKNGNIHDIYLTTGDVDFNIWSGCQYVFSKNSCQVKCKPKVFIVQVCRGPCQRPGDENTENETQQDMHFHFIRKLGSLKEYIFLFGTQPDEAAHRNCQRNFIESVCEIVTKNSGKHNLQNILTTQLTGLCRNNYHQMPLLVTCMSSQLNIFPGITNDKLEPSNSVNSQENKSHPKGGNTSENRASQLVKKE